MLDDFAKVNYIFCDKTGTLTKNELIFKCLGCGHERFNSENRFTINLKSSSEPRLKDLFRCINICHEVTKIRKDDGSEYLNGASLDEICFIEMTRDANFITYKDRDQETIRIDVDGTAEEYKILKVYQFTSDRKCMSVIVRRTGDNKLFSFVKGADTAIMPALNNRGEWEEAVLASMESYASTGLRTLLFSMKELTEGDVNDIDTLEDPFKFERAVTLLGTTGIEDLLQDNVAKCINDFKRAKCKVLMLTGDKGSTAHSVGIACGLIDP